MTLKNILTYTIITSLIMVCAIYIASVTLIGQASAPSGLPATAATSSVITFDDTTVVETLFTPNSICAARIISTASTSIRLAFEADHINFNNAISSTTLTDTIGFLQDASTTVAYDSGLYGCGWVSALGSAGSQSVQTVNVMETW